MCCHVNGLFSFQKSKIKNPIRYVCSVEITDLTMPDGDVLWRACTSDQDNNRITTSNKSLPQGLGLERVHFSLSILYRTDN